MNAAVPKSGDPNCWDLCLRFVHELQTAMRRQRGARPQFRSIADGMRGTVPAALALLPRTREAQAVLLHKGIFASAVALLVVFGAKFEA